MTVENIFSMAVAVICISPILIIGIVQYNSKRPVGFWAGKEPPKEEQITDVKAYNHRHGIMWLLYGIGFLICFGCILFMDAVAASILAVAESIGGIFVMIAYHGRLDRIYGRKTGSGQ